MDQKYQEGTKESWEKQTLKQSNSSLRSNIQFQVQAQEISSNQDSKCASSKSSVWCSWTQILVRDDYQIVRDL